MTADVDHAPDLVPDAVADDGREHTIEADVYLLLLGLAGFLPYRLLSEARDQLAVGRRAEAVRAVAFEVVTRSVQLSDAEIDLLRTELAGGGADGDLAAALEEVRGERQPEGWLFLSAVPTGVGDTTQVVLPLDLTGEPVDRLDPVDRALVAEASAVPGVRAVWRAWRMPPAATPWQAPVRVAVVSSDDDDRPLPVLAAQLQRAMAAAGDPEAQAEVCRPGFVVPPYHTLARSCGALLWASRAATPVTTAPVFDGADSVRGPWFGADHPVVPAGADRERLLAALDSGLVITWSSAQMVDVFDPDGDDVVPMHLRTDGSWVWSEAVAYYLDRHGLAPHPGLVRQLGAADRAVLPDEVAVHRVLVHLLRRGSQETVWQRPVAT